MVKHRIWDRVSDQKLLSDVFTHRLNTVYGGFSEVTYILVITSSFLS